MIAILGETFPFVILWKHSVDRRNIFGIGGKVEQTLEWASPPPPPSPRGEYMSKNLKLSTLELGVF